MSSSVTVTLPLVVEYFRTSTGNGYTHVLSVNDATVATTTPNGDAFDLVIAANISGSD